MRLFRPFVHRPATTAGALASGLTALAATAMSCASPRPTSPAAALPASTRPVVPLTKPALAPLTRPAFALSNVVEQTLPARPAFAHVAVQATVRTLSTRIEAATAELSKHPGLAERAAGPATLVYRGMTAQLDQPFELEVGFPVRDGFEPAGGVRVRPLPALRCLSAEFTGPTTAIDKAYDRLLPTVSRMGLQPTGEVREVYVRWEGPASENNQILVAVGVR